MTENLPEVPTEPLPEVPTKEPGMRIISILSIFDFVNNSYKKYQFGNILF